MLQFVPELSYVAFCGTQNIVCPITLLWLWWFKSFFVAIGYRKQFTISCMTLGCWSLHMKIIGKKRTHFSIGTRSLFVGFEWNFQNVPSQCKDLPS